jgi:hypothetical protein
MLAWARGSHRSTSSRCSSSSRTCREPGLRVLASLARCLWIPARLSRLRLGRFLLRCRHQARPRPSRHRELLARLACQPIPLGALVTPPRAAWRHNPSQCQAALLPALRGLCPCRQGEVAGCHRDRVATSSLARPLQGALRWASSCQRQCLQAVLEGHRASSAGLSGVRVGQEWRQLLHTLADLELLSQVR